MIKYAYSLCKDVPQKGLVIAFIFYLLIVMIFEFLCSLKNYFIANSGKLASFRRILTVSKKSERSEKFRSRRNLRASML